ncbi:LAMI_0F02674g1_1 [Lachancea mirantina]|uniref:Restriction of telomere capping protein 4 n=1 Tax=Lachancea mirantina TaxID=1230905 RepID=A0A1G4JWR4_9SACH|nr:LAMI_0F02674g1_1 [Lachancea mirantina]
MTNGERSSEEEEQEQGEDVSHETTGNEKLNQEFIEKDSVSNRQDELTLKQCRQNVKRSFELSSDTDDSLTLFPNSGSDVEVKELEELNQSDLDKFQQLDEYEQARKRVKQMFDEQDQRERELDSVTAKSKVLDPITLAVQNHESGLAKFEAILELRRETAKRSQIPSAMFAADLVTAIEEHLPIVVEILSGKRPSLFYNEARSAQRKSKRAIMSIQEFRQLDHRKFVAGFYGLRRQLRVANEIFTHFQDLLTFNKNPVLQWWGPRDFAQCVLAPEVLSALCQKQMRLSSVDDAWDVMESTRDFGLIVADNDPLETWEVAIEQDELVKLGLGPEYSSMTYRNST